MRIIHYCLSSFYIDGMNYQENALIREHVKAGHEVLVIASTENQGPDKTIIYDEPREYIGDEGARVIRLPYIGFPHALARKLRIHPRVYKITEEFKPDAALFHSMCGWELLTVAKYKRRNPKLILYADSHEDRHNSGRSFLSLEILHKRYYAPIAKRASKHLKKVLCINVSAMEFMRDVYKLPEDKLEFFPLAGEPLSLAHIAKTRTKTRKALGIDNDKIVMVQSGKQTKRKKLIESLNAFAKIDDPNIELLIIGVLFEDIKAEAEALIAKDARVTFLGWKTPEELTDILCAADIYLQPGTQSATMQNSLCAGCAVILDDVPSHAPYFVDNGWRVNSSQKLETIFADIRKKSAELPTMMQNSNDLAHKLLDYSVQAERVLQSQ